MNKLGTKIKEISKAKFITTDFSMFKLSDFFKAFFMWLITANVMVVLLILIFQNISESIAVLSANIFSVSITMIWLTSTAAKKTDLKTTEIVNNSIAGFFKNFTKFRTILTIILIILIIDVLNVGSVIITNGIQELLNLQVVNENQESIAMMLKQSGLMMMIQGIIVAPIFEEVLYRGLFQTTLSKYLTRFANLTEKQIYWISVLVVSFAFGFIHNWSFNPFLVMPYFVMALYFQHVAHKYNSLYASIYAHIGMNFFAFVDMLTKLN